MLFAAVGLLVVAIASEFMGVEWWSAVDVKRLEQRFVIVRNGYIYVGDRSTKGFFTRSIPLPGWRRVHVRGQGWWARRLVPQRVHEPLLIGVSVPLVSPALIAAGIGGWLLVVKGRRTPGRCRGCGYDVQGLEVCPECGMGVKAEDAV